MHALDGMGMVLDEAPERPVKKPRGFPVCTNFYDDHSRDVDYVESVYNTSKSYRICNLLHRETTLYNHECH